MKKYFYSLFAAAATLFAATSCSQDEFAENTGLGETVNVSFSVQTSQATQTRTLPDGKEVGQGNYATSLICAVYENGKGTEKALMQYTKQDGDDGTTDGRFSITIPLVKGVKYDVLFLAYNKENNVFGITDGLDADLKALTLKDNLLANQEAYDVFCNYEEAYQATGAGKTVYLTRPFAQLNVGTTLTDLKDAADLDVIVAKSAFQIKNVPTTLNVLEGVVSNEIEELTLTGAELFQTENAVAEGEKYANLKNETFIVNRKKDEGGKYINETFYYLGMTYVLADTEKTLHDTDVLFYRGEGKDTHFNTITVSNLPLQRNYRTNIIGNLLTTQEAFDVIIVPGFTDEQYNTQEELESVLVNGGSMTLFEDLELTAGTSLTIAEGKTVTINLNGHKISNPVEGTAAIINKGTLTLKNGKVVNENITAQGAAAIHNYGKLILENVNAGSDLNRGAAVQNKDGDVIINGGTYATMDREHSSNGFAYVFINNKGTMTINNATVNGRPNGVFYASAGSTIVVNDGSYSIKEGANTWYMAYAEDATDDAEAAVIYLNGGKFTWNKGTAIQDGATTGNVIISSEADINWTVAERSDIIHTQDAFTAALSNGGTILLGKPQATTKADAADYTWNNTAKDVEIVGVEDGITIGFNSGALNGSAGAENISFNNIILQFPNVDNTGFQHTVTESYTNCTIGGQLFLYATSATFNACTFNQTSADAYHFWTYGSATVDLNNCTLNSAGKSILAYNEGYVKETVLTLNNCTLTASAPVEGKAAIEVDSRFTGYTININNTTDTGFSQGSISGSTLVNHKMGNNATIYIDGKEFVADGVAKADENTYEISNLNGLKWFASRVNGVLAYGNYYGATSLSGKTVKLTADIDLANEAWTPIGLNSDDDKKFQGTFDGQGHIISNLTVETEAGYTAAGFFGALNGTAKNFTINGATIKHISTGSATDNGIAVVAGSIYSSGTIEGVTVKNAKVEGNRYLGGISGYTYGNVKNCTVENIKLTATPDKETGKYDNGDKVGGIAGYFACESTYEISGNTVKNVTIKGYRDLGGVVGCADGNIKNNAVNGGTITVDQTTNFYEKKDYNADVIVGRKQSNMTVDASNTATDVQVVLPLSSLITADATTGNITLDGDVTGAADSNSGYGAAGLVIDNGATFDGKGHTLTVNNANGTWDCAVNAKNGTIKNLTINGAFRGIFMGSATGDVVIDNVVLDKVCYTFNSDGGNKEYSVTIKNSTLNGWTSYSDVHEHVTFTSCKFGKGTGGYQYAFCRPYNASTFENCEFAEGFEFDTTQQSNIVFKNCTYNGLKITAENAATLTTFFYNGVSNVTFE